MATCSKFSSLLTSSSQLRRCSIRKCVMQIKKYEVYNPTTLRTMAGVIALNGSIQWQLLGSVPEEECDGIRINMPLSDRIEKRGALQFVEQRLQRNGINFLRRRGLLWRFDLDDLRNAVPGFLDGLDWATGTAVIEPEVEFVPAGIGSGDSTYVRFNVYKEEYVLERQNKIFLSHKGADKPLVRHFFGVLKTIGFDPWLDEDAMTAGVELERGILQGFKESCAAVFFITPNYKDENFLRTEVNYAIAEKRAKDQRFAIITVVLADREGRKGEVPELLKQYVWKEPATELEAMNEILRALPIEPSEPRWRV